jgi:hypothetical protein
VQELFAGLLHQVLPLFQSLQLEEAEVRVVKALIVAVPIKQGEPEAVETLDM